MNDLPSSIIAYLMSYAVDLNLLTSAGFFQDLAVDQWLVGLAEGWGSKDKPILNKDKWNYMIFGLKQSNIEIPHNVVFNSSKLFFSKNVELLGNCIDSHLDWRKAVGRGTARLNSLTYSIRFMRSYLIVSQWT